MIPLKGLASNLVFASRIATGKSTDSLGKVTELKRSEDYYRTVGKYVRGKFAPVPGAVTNILIGEDVVGNVSTVRSELVGLIMPMSPTDIYEQFKTMGPVEATGAMGLTLLGAGGNVYGEGLSPKQRLTIWLSKNVEAGITLGASKGDTEQDFKKKSPTKIKYYP